MNSTIEELKVMKLGELRAIAAAWKMVFVEILGEQMWERAGIESISAKCRTRKNEEIDKIIRTRGLCNSLKPSKGEYEF